MAEKYDWRYENSINTKDRYLDVNAAGEPKYSGHRTNKSLCNYPDTVLEANDMNISYWLDAKLQYDYLYYGIRKRRRRFENRSKAKHNDEDFALVQAYYKYSDKKTFEALAVLTEEQLVIIRKKMDKGGVR